MAPQHERDARAHIDLLSGLAGCVLVLQHGTNLFPQFRRIGMTVHRASMQYGETDHFILGSGDGNRAGLFGRELATINYFPRFGHIGLLFEIRRNYSPGGTLPSIGLKNRVAVQSREPTTVNDCHSEPIYR
jgi:hypothetical protein